MILIHATMTIDSSKEALFLTEMATLLEASRAEQGNISYDLTKVTGKENEFKMIEVWEDMTAVSEHNTSAHFTAFVEKAKEFLIAPLQASVYDATQIK